MKNPEGFVTSEFLEMAAKRDQQRPERKLLRVGSPYPGCEIIAWGVVVLVVAFLVARAF